jgi:hypothetical protein
VGRIATQSGHRIEPRRDCQAPVPPQCEHLPRGGQRRSAPSKAIDIHNLFWVLSHAWGVRAHLRGHSGSEPRRVPEPPQACFGDRGMVERFNIVINELQPTRFYSREDG